MFVHVERQDRRDACKRVRVVSRPLIHEPPIAMRVGEQHPTGPAAEGLAHTDELGAPANDAPEVTLKGLVEDTTGTAVTAEAIELRS